MSTAREILPGELCDKRGVPVYPGDLLRTYHFTGARRKKYYMYHVVTERNGRLYVTPTAYLHKPNGGECLLYLVADSDFEVIAGHGPDDILHYSDRKKQRDKQG